MVGGRAVPSDEPGLGIAWDWDAIAAMAEPGLGFDKRNIE